MSDAVSRASLPKVPDAPEGEPRVRRAGEDAGGPRGPLDERGSRVDERVPRSRPRGAGWTEAGALWTEPSAGRTVEGTGCAPGFSVRMEQGTLASLYFFARALSGTLSAPSREGTLPLGYGTLPFGYGTLPLGYGTVPRGYGTLPLGYASIPLEGFTRIREGATVPAGEDARPKEGA
jgi:hypothetical protein